MAAWSWATVGFDAERVCLDVFPATLRTVVNLALINEIKQDTLKLNQ